VVGGTGVLLLLGFRSGFSLRSVSWSIE
jgi:hypothetical protein